MISETCKNVSTRAMRVHELLHQVSVSFQPHQAKESQNLRDPSLTLHRLSNKGGMKVKPSLYLYLSLSPLSVYVALSYACFLSLSLSSQLHSIT